MLLMIKMNNVFLYHEAFKDIYFVMMSNTSEV